MTDHPLKGVSRWATAPSLFMAGSSAAFAILYGAIVLTFAPGTLWPFVGIAGIAALLGVFFGSGYQQSGLTIIRRLGLGTLAPSRETLDGAVRETLALPGRSMMASVFTWIPATLVVVVTFRAVHGVTTAQCLRIGTLALAVGALSSILVYLLVLQRARRVVERIAAQGLSLSDVIRAMPPERTRLRTRLMAFLAVATVTPSILLAVAVNTQADEAVNRLIQLRDAGERDQVLTAFYGVQRAQDIGLAAIVALAAIGSASILGSALRDPLRAIATEAIRLSQGELQQPRLIAQLLFGGETVAAFASMHAQMVRALDELRRAGDKLTSTTTQVQRATDEQESGAAEQAIALNETAATTEELARSAGQIASNASEVAQLAERALAAAQKGQRNALSFSESMIHTKQGNQRVADAVLRLNKRVQQIGTVIEFINGVGDKSDLLALNAELEGTKAGDIGRGFSLVAAEMRRLAESVLRSTSEIGKLITEIRDGTHTAVMATEAGLKASAAGAETADQMLESLHTLLDLARQTSEAVKTISAATLQQGTGTDQLATAMAEILHITHDGASSTDRMAKASDQLTQLSQDLRTTVDQFRWVELQPGADRGPTHG